MVCHIFEEPFYIFLICHLLVSTLTTSKRYLYVTNLFILLIYSLYLLTKNTSCLVGWILLSSVFLIIIYKIKHKLMKVFGREEKIEFDSMEKYIYDRDFRLLFTEEEFKTFISLGQMKITKDSDNLALEDGHYDKLIYIATIPAYRSVMLKAKDTLISYLHEGSWLGVVEFILYLSDRSNKKWLITIELESEINITYYEWDLVSITNLFEYSSDYKFINKLLLLWIKYLTHSVKKLDDHVANALRAMVYKDKKAMENTLPIYRYISGIEKKKIVTSFFDDEEEFPFVRKHSKLNKVGQDLDELKE